MNQINQKSHSYAVNINQMNLIENIQPDQVKVNFKRFLSHHDVTCCPTKFKLNALIEVNS